MATDPPPIHATFFPTPADFRAWLETNHDTAPELLVGYYKKGTGRASVSLPQGIPHMYIVRMKRVTASQARREWFRILDEVVAGEVVIVDRKGRSIQIRRLDPPPDADAIPDYSGILAVHEGAEDADRWGWEWTENGEEGLHPVDREDP